MTNRPILTNLLSSSDSSPPLSSSRSPPLSGIRSLLSDSNRCYRLDELLPKPLADVLEREGQQREALKHYLEDFEKE
jgi:hypothetical protein